MKSFFNNKIWVILLVIGAFIGLVALAAGLEELEFQQPFSLGLDGNSRPFFLSDLEPGTGSLWFRYLIPGLLLLMYLLMLGPRPQGKSNVMSSLIRGLGFIFFIMLFLSIVARRGGLLSPEALAGLNVPYSPELVVPGFSPPTLTSGWAFWITSLLIVVFGVAIVFVVNRTFDRWFKPGQGVEEIAEIARTALSGLSGSKPPRNVIVRCYLDMNNVVGEKQGVIREAAVTPAEFAVRLEEMGFPNDAVQGLTEVFERVRYGGLEASMEEIEEAKRCLTSILKACEKKR